MLHTAKRSAVDEPIYNPHALTAPRFFYIAKGKNVGLVV